jgi:superfamily II DNA or RNA helicase
MTTEAHFDRMIAASNAKARDYQKRIVTKSVDFLNSTVTNLMIQSPTGSGKTCMGLAAAKMIQEQHNIGVGWMAMRRNLLSQAAEENRNLGFNIDGFTTISMFDKNPPKVDSKGRPIKLLISDEAQHDVANSSMNIHNTIKPEWVIGLTATPHRQDKMKLCFDKTIRDIGIRQLIQLGYLSKFHHYTLNEYTPETVTRQYLSDPDKWGKSIMFWHKTHDLHRCVRLLRDGGVAADFIVGTDSVREQERKIEAFSNGQLDVLVNLFILTEGFDDPSIKTAWVRPSSQSPTIQMGGRAFRIHPDLPYKQIVQCQKSKWPLTRTASPEEQYVWSKEHNHWMSIKENANLREISAKSLRFLVRRDKNRMPDFFGKGKSKIGTTFAS